MVRTNQSAPARHIGQPTSTWRRGCRISCGAAVPTPTLLKIASEGRLNDPVVLEQQVRRMLKDPRAEALTTNFAGQWLNLRGLDAHAPLPVVYPDFDDPLRQAMRTEVELLFDSVVREDRSIIDLLTADYTFVNERLAKHYGIPNIYGSQFRRITLGPEMDVRQGLLGKARHSDDDGQARAHVAGDARQVDHDEPARDEPAGSAAERSAAAAAGQATRPATRSCRRCA